MTTRVSGEIFMSNVRTFFQLSLVYRDASGQLSYDIWRLSRITEGTEIILYFVETMTLIALELFQKSF